MTGRYLRNWVMGTALAVTKLKLFKNQLRYTIFVTFWRNNRDRISSTWSLHN